MVWSREDLKTNRQAGKQGRNQEFAHWEGGLSEAILKIAVIKSDIWKLFLKLSI